MKYNQKKLLKYKLFILFTVIPYTISYILYTTNSVICT